MSQRKFLQEIIDGFSSYEEEANFWDTADLSEYEDEFEPAEVEVSPDLGHIFGIAFDRAETRRLSAIARSKDVKLIPLMRSWIMEALERAEQAAKDQPVSRVSAD